MTDQHVHAVQENPHNPETEFKRDMGFWGNLALGFTYLSPVVGIYTTLAASLAIAGPPAFWMLAIAGFGQLLVALVFGEVVSQFPIAGGVYPWNRQLWGRKWGWVSGWIYAVAICATIASVAYGAGPFLGLIIGVEINPVVIVLLALAIIAVATVINFGGTKLLSNVAFFGFAAEIVATIAIGAWLLIGARKHDFSVLFTDFRPAELISQQPFALAFAGAAITGVFLFYGFEACGDVAEEVKDPGTVVPRAMRTTIYVGGVAAMFIGLGLILAIPDFGAVINGTATDPIGSLFLEVFGPVGFKIVMAVILISYLSCVISLQAAASRLLYSMGRDRQLPGSTWLARFDRKRAVPPFALIVTALFPAVVLGVSLLSPDALTAIVSFSSLGIYLAFGMVVVASLRARLKGWQPAGEFRLGRWGYVVTIAALVWQVFGMLVLIEPVAGAPWYQAWLVLLSTIVVVAVGLIYMVIAKPYARAGGTHGTAIPQR